MKKIEDLKLTNQYLYKYELNKYLNSNLLDNLEMYLFKKGEMICTLNEEMFYIYFLVSGKAKVYTLLSTGKSLLISFITPLSIMGDVEFLGNSLADCNVMALEDCTCLTIPLSKVKEYACDDPVFLRFIILFLEKKLRNNSIHSSINMFYPLENRFASYILSLLPSTNTNIVSVELEGLNHIAELLGGSYRHLNRVIKNLTNDNIIKKEKNTITILALDKLKDLAQDIYL